MIWAWSLILSYPMIIIVILFQFVLYVDKHACCLSQQLRFAVLPWILRMLRGYDSHARFAAGLPSRFLYVL